MRTRDDLRQLQSLPLSLKIRLTQSRIRQWVNEYGIDGVYISFSGGKDSTVLLTIAREIYPNIKAVFVDTGLEYPEVRDFVKTWDNVEWLKPKMTFRQVIEKYGYPFISKEVSECVSAAKKYLTEIQAESTIDRQTDRQTDSGISGISKSIDNSVDLLNTLKRDKGRKQTLRLARMLGMLTKNGSYQIKENILSKDRSVFSMEKYRFLLLQDSPNISNVCCNIMKKNPAHTYGKKTGRKPITAEMADESRLRTQKWLQNGCNGFQMKSPKSTPMAFWTEQDVLLYIYKNKIKIASVYGDVVKENEVDGQLDFEDLGIFEFGNQEFKTTGCKRTGCMFCGFGCHLEKSGEGRFELMKATHPKTYEWIMKPWDQGGLDYKNVIDWLNEHGNLNIRY